MCYIDIVLDKLQTQKDILFPRKKLLCGKRRSFFNGKIQKGSSYKSESCAGAT